MPSTIYQPVMPPSQEIHPPPYFHQPPPQSPSWKPQQHDLEHDSTSILGHRYLGSYEKRRRKREENDKGLSIARVEGKFGS